jgi:hypothetical protein
MGGQIASRKKVGPVIGIGVVPVEVRTVEFSTSVITVTDGIFLP